jgi:pimeloyl-ACP methyl ester carboxylesterase
MTRTRTLLLSCGVTAAALYAGMNVVIPPLWNGYSCASQTISELSAVGAPTRSSWVPLGLLYALLLTAFGWGVRATAAANRPLRIAGLLLMADGIFVMGWPPMHQRAVLAAGGATLTDTLHIAWTIATLVMTMLAMGLAAAALGKRFRLYTIATMVTLVVFGVLTGLDAPRVEANLPTPWTGVWERICAGANMAWLAVLAVVLLRQRAADAIDEAHYLRLGGVRQWVMLRGDHAANPPLVVLHGGPGLSETALFRHFNDALERTFTVVYWDQRGAGRSADRAIPKSSMRVEQFISDLDELVDWVRARLGAPKVAILGHSWGSTLGVLYAARFPEKVAVFVGNGQIGNAPEGEALSYAAALAAAERAGNRRALKALRKIGPPPYDASALWTERSWLARLELPWTLKTLATMVRMAPSMMRGFRWTIDAMWPEVSKLNLVELVPRLQMPVFFLLGRHDHWAPADAAVDYFQTLRAPSKHLIWFDESGHEAFVDEADKFNRVMVDLVRPAAECRT